MVVAMKFEHSFWGDQGRVARLTSGPYSGHYAFIYPDSRPEWWAIVIDPSPYPDAPLEFYLEGNAELESLILPWNPHWLPIDSDSAVERTHFGQRPLRGVSWIGDS